MKHVTLGTAGHIDHGKTALVKRLTGTDTDRLAEEKKRGMTIELGFAFLELPSGTTVSIVDVPGHEKFVKTMVAGVTGIDFVLLVIAADEGVMPQTSEHIDILSVLGMNSGIIVLSKADLVNEQEIQLRIAEITNKLKGTSLDGFEIIPVSARTGKGVTELIHKIDELTDKVSRSLDKSLFRLPIDRVFTMPGHGTIVTGTVFSGIINKGETVDIMPEGLSSKIRNIQVRNKNADQAIAGDRCALNLPGIEKDQLKRGSVIVGKGKVNPVRLIDAEVVIVPGADDLMHNQRVHLHTGTSAVIARVRMLGAESIPAKARGFVQLRLEEPIVALRGDRFILRSYSPVRTIGGGVVLAHRTKNRRRFDVETLDLMRALKSGDDRELIIRAAEGIDKPFDIQKLQEETQLDKKTAQQLIDELVLEGEIIFLKNSNNYLSGKSYCEALKVVENEFNKLYKKYPYRYRLSKEELKSKAFPALPAKDWAGIIGILLNEAQLISKGNDLSLAKNKREEEIEKSKEVLRVKKIVSESGPALFTENLLPFCGGINKDTLIEVIAFLKSISWLEELTDGHYASKEMIFDIYKHIRKLIETKGVVTVAELRDVLAISRKETIIYLEYFDKKLVTKREGNERRPGAEFMLFS